jgi:hypothetical protein
LLQPCIQELLVALPLVSWFCFTSFEAIGSATNIKANPSSRGNWAIPAENQRNFDMSYINITLSNTSMQ